MTDLRIGTLRATATVAGADDERRLRGLLADLTGRRLDEALAGVDLPAGDWCVRRLEVPLRLDDAAADPVVARRWADDITRAISGSVSGPSAGGSARDGHDVVHYPRRPDAAVDVVASLAAGDLRRAWAWQAVGVLGAQDPDPLVVPAGTVAAVLGRDPASAVHVLAAAVTRVGLAALHRLLGASGWRAVAGVVVRAAGDRSPSWLDAAPDDAAPDPAGPGGPADDPGVPEVAAPDGATVGGAAPGGRPATGPVLPAPNSLQRSDSSDRGRAATVSARSVAERSAFARAWRSSRLRPEERTARAWAVIAVAEAEPALLRLPHAGAVLALLPSVVSGDPSSSPAVRRTGAAVRPVGPAPATDTATAPVTTPVTTPEPEAARAEVAGPPTAAADAPPALPDDTFTPGDVPPGAAVGAPTSCAGLVHLLATAVTAGLPDALLADPALAADPLSWSLFRLYGRLLPPGAADDPVRAALAGLPPGSAPGPEPDAVRSERLDLHAARWAAVTAARLPASEPPDDARTVAALVARDGWVEVSPGWVEVRLRLADVDLDVRRAGLDLDPGFVPWLGVVVVIRYD